MHPLTLPQQAIFVDALLHHETTKHTMAGGIVIRGALDGSLFRQAIEFAFRHHDTQSIRIHVEGDQARQEFVEDATCSFEALDLSGRSEPFRAAVDWMLADITRPVRGIPFPPSSDALLRLSDDLHVWYAKFHHIANDAFGHALLSGTLAAAYNSLLHHGRLPELERHSYRDFIREDSEYAQSDRFRQDQEFWRGKFASMPEPLPFTARRHGLIGDVLKTDRCALGVHRLVYNAVLRVCEKAEVTAPQLLVAALLAYLSRLTGRDEIVVGMPILNRSNHAFRRTAGMFMNMMPLRVSVPKGMTVLALARQIASELRSCYRRQRFPLSEVVRHCRTVDGFCQVVFDVTFVHRKLDYDARFGGCSMRPITLDPQARDETLSLEIDEYNSDEDVNFFFNYKPSLIPADSAISMAKAFEALLIDLAVAGDRAVSEIRLMAETAAPAARHASAVEKTALDLIAERAAEAPHNIAVVDSSTRWTYRELAEASGRVAAFLAHEGIEAEQPVAVLCDRSVLWVAAQLGIMQAGGAYLPLDPDAPQDRLAFILQDSGCRFLLTGNSQSWPEFSGVRTVRIDDLQRFSTVDTTCRAGMRSLAYLIYTSGTTGRPKGVLVEHAGLVNTATVLIDQLGLEARDRFVQFASPMFDASMAEVFPTLIAGSSLLIAPREVTLDPSRFVELLSREHATVAILPTAYLSALNRAPLESLRIVGTAGEAANPADVAHYSRTKTFINLYGPTETSIIATTLLVQAGSGFTGERVPIGAPIANVDIHILDENLQPMPVGAEGEICISGVNVTRGYLNRPQLTAERFVTNPFREGGRMYRSGDIGRRLPDGNIEFLGRRDTQVKIRGYRVELGEIETLLKTHPGIQTAAVVAVSGILVGYFVPRGDVHPADLRRFLALKLPAYMVPSCWVAMASLPVNSSGKVDPAQLPPPPPAAHVDEGAAPVTATEKSIARIWEEVLGCGPVSRTADFFEVGGHSLKAISILAQIERSLGVHVEVRQFLSGPTVAELATAVEEAAAPVISSATPESRSDALSSLQERIWLVSQMDPDSVAYIMPCHLRIRGRLDTKAFEEALRFLWQRHEALRSIFPSRDGRPVRAVLPADALVIHSYALTAWEEHYRAHHAGPLHLDKGPLFRVCIYRVAAEEHVVLIDIHHINGDATSLEVLQAELFKAYQALREGREPVLPAPGAPYARFIDRERDLQTSEGWDAAMERRIQELTGAPVQLHFQFDKQVPGPAAHRGNAVLHHYEDLDLPGRAFESARREGLSPFMTALAAFGTMLHRHTGQEEMLIGIPTSLRGGERFARTVGFFVNTCVVRLDFRGNPTLREILKRTRRAVTDMLRLPEAPFDLLVRRLDAHRAPGRAPLVQAALSFVIDDTAPQWAAKDLAVEPLYLARDSAMFELSMDVILHRSHGICSLEYAARAWEEPSVRRMLDHFHAILQAIAANPALRAREVDVRPPAGILTGEPMDKPARSAPDWIREHALRRPNSTALVAAGVETSYAQLDRLVALRRGQLATLGLDCGATLALACSPGLEWTVTALAAMAEGIVVAPLDVNAPEARRRYILENCRAALVWSDTSGADAPSCASQTGPVKAAPDATAYIIYTSGTTGQPKGVRVSHGAFETHCRSAIRAYGLREDDRALAFAPPHFDASWEQLFAPMVAGAAVVISGAELQSPEEWCRHLSEARVTCADIPPQFLREVLFFLERHPECAPRSLRQVLSGGEAMRAAVAASWLTGPLGALPLINVYGPTEAVVTATFHRIDKDARIAPANGVVPIGAPMPGRVLHILGADGVAAAAGTPGELCIGGAILADGYQDDEARTNEAFRYWLCTPEGGRWVESGTPGSVRLYRSGDRVRLGPDNRIEFLGRIDRQIKVRGFRIEPAEIEAALTQHPAIAQALALGVEQQIVAYCVPAGTEAPSREDLVEWLSASLPPYMIPSATVFLRAFPTTSAGKIDIGALPPPEAPAGKPAAVSSSDGLEGRVAAIWAGILGRSSIGPDENFFDVGGHSLLLVRLHTRLVDELGARVRLVDLFANPTVARMAKLLRGESASNKAAPSRRTQRPEIAVIGMAGRFPGAANVDELWANLTAGRESIRFFSNEELAVAGVPASLRARPEYVPAHGHLEGIKLFDAAFFGYTPKEAEVIDPQQRLFLEESWHALENAGYDPERYAGDIAVFAGTGMNVYLLENLIGRLQQEHGPEAYALSLANDKDFVTTRVSYKLNLRGPSVNVNTACSTSLVAIHMAAESLIAGECDMALAGGVTLQVPPSTGYLYQPGGIASPDGHCRAFAEDAAGTVGGSGVAIVVLKRLDEALADGDTIHAVITGSAINNDGADKVGFTAPGVNRQRDVIRTALDRAGAGADSIGYVEAHGTGTPMGDPIEIEALSKAFTSDHPQPQNCLIGSIKTNTGHLDTAAGAAGLIKAVLAIEHGLIPPSLHCERPGSRLELERTPFRIASELTPWTGSGPRRAGISSFGMGGTNAHVIIEQAPAAAQVGNASGEWRLPISARTARSLLASAANLARHLEEHPELNPADVQFTLSAGRRRFPVSAMVRAASSSEAITALRSLRAEDLSSEQDPGDEPLPPGPHRRVPLPGYVFDHETYWVEPARSDVPVKLPLPEWFHFPGWEQLPARRVAPPDTPVLIVHNGTAAELRWMETLRKAGVPFTAESPASLEYRGEVPGECWHIVAMGFDAGAPAEYALRLDALLSDTRALAAARNGQRMKLLLFAPSQEPAFAYLDAACAVIPREYESIVAKVLYVDPQSTSAAAVLSGAELAANDRILGIWNGKLWRRTWSALPAGRLEQGSARLKEKGVYLLTGGFGGIGLTLADHLARAVKARVVLVSRRKPDPVQREAISAMEAAGAEVRTAALDVADAAALRALVEDVSQRWGRIDGVIHAAGVPGGSLIARTRLDEIERVLRAKVAGTAALAAALEGRDPSFVVLCSSLTASIGDPGQAAYAAANAWQDAFAAEQSARRPGVWTSIEWDTWGEAGMAAQAGAVVKEWRITPDSYWPWGEHRIAGTATLPGTAYLEMFAQALDGPSAELGPVVLFEPMVERGEGATTVQVLREREELVIRSFDNAGTREHARANDHGAPDAPVVEPLAAIQARCTARLEGGAAHGSQAIIIEAGPRWKARGEYWKGRDEGFARVELAGVFASDLATHPLHPALLDIAISFYITAIDGGMELLPWRYEKVRVFAPLTPVVFSHVRLRSRSERSLVLDAEVRDASGRLLIAIDGYTLVRAAARRANPGAVTNPFAMTRKEGVEVFLRALDMAEPVVCISTVDWKHAAAVATVASSGEEMPATAEASPGIRQSRPETATAFREAENEAQKMMARVWAEVLGYERIGIDDNLFDLGADSLTALRASARLKKLTGRELPLERFFENPTIVNLVADLQPAAEIWEEGEL